MKLNILNFIVYSAISLLAVNAEAKQFCFKHGTSSCVKASTPSNPETPAQPSSPSLSADQNNVFGDNVARNSCLDYKNAYPTSASGKYYLTVGSNKVPVYCEMTIDGGGWTQIYYQHEGFDFKNTSFVITHKDLIRNNNLKTLTTDSTQRPSLPSGTKNTFNRLLFIGGTSAWRQAHGDWFSFDVIPAAVSGRVPLEYSNVNSQRGASRLWNSYIAFGYSTAPETGRLDLWGFEGQYALCGGGGWSAPKNCPTFANTVVGYSYHYDTASKKELFVR